MNKCYDSKKIKVIVPSSLLTGGGGGGGGVDKDTQYTLSKDGDTKIKLTDSNNQTAGIVDLLDIIKSDVIKNEIVETVNEAGDEIEHPEYAMEKVGDKIILKKDGAEIANIDLSMYVDDTNLSRLIEGELNDDFELIVKRDDGTSFKIDMSKLADNFIDDVTFDDKTYELKIERGGKEPKTFSVDLSVLHDEETQPEFEAVTAGEAQADWNAV